MNTTLMGLVLSTVLIAALAIRVPTAAVATLLAVTWIFWLGVVFRAVLTDPYVEH